ALYLFSTLSTTQIHTLSLHDALPIYEGGGSGLSSRGTNERNRAMPELTVVAKVRAKPGREADLEREFRAIVGPTHAELGCLRYTDRKSTRLNSSHLVISYAVFCLKKK